ncbi:MULTISPECIES: lipoprotein-releasing ABC transporter permease subunit [Sphingomonadales]|uniref:Lipoprotein-releasing system transmembrane protein LolE n=1 Tax=Edaphosphingomonas haloaromaticamans TaxID=653954 RepID=A0A1S1HGE6_9SPHN|nr:MULTISPECIES: lipoprotein-releasing ABC transporter permease subunit [Sphingomonas]AGH48437.1 LolC/E family lipoprotein releasing system, transmembrane protein [Sphingomonas sp. MM-1]OHT20912.1 Lipoprotein-releasing system transmembrane protein LolE [Sphingomonas haloaromaticamans]
MILSRFERTIAKRYLWPGKGEGFIFLVAAISLFAVTLGVWALITVMSVMNGFRAELFDKVVGLNGHAVVQGYGGRLPDWQAIVREAQATPGVTSATPLIEQPLMASYDGRVEGVLVRGMRVEDIRANPTLKGHVVAGTMDALVPGSENVAIGSRLAEALGAEVGGQISLISPQGQTTPFGTVPRIVSYRVAAIFEVGVYDYDKAFVLLPMEDAQTLLMLGDAVGMVEIETADPDKVGAILAPLAAKVGRQGVVTDWRQMNASLFEALAVERVAMFVILAFIVLVAAFNILSSLIMLVRAKTRDIAIMRTMGATSRSILKIFIAIGLSISIAGIVVGIVFAVVTALFRQQVVNFVQAVTGQNLWDPSIRFLTELPYKANPFEITAIIGLTLGLSFLATLIPAWRAAKTDPVQVLRYE